MSNPRFDLVDIVKTLNKRSRFILSVTLLAGVFGTIFYFVFPRKYQAKAEFLVSSPLIGDRNNIFRTVQSQFIGSFANEDDLDKVISIAKSDTVRNIVAAQLNLGKVWNLDLSKRKDADALEKKFNSNFQYKRTEYQNLELSYTDKDPKLAADITNACIATIEKIYRGYYNQIRLNTTNALQQKIHEADSTIAIMTDTLAALRDKYKIYDIISPARQTIISGSLKSNGAADFGRAVEEIQNVEATKDQLVQDRASYISLMNEFTTGTRVGEMPLVQVISPALPPVSPKGLSMVLNTIAFLLIGFFFSAIWVLITTYFGLLLNTERN